ncbi:MAG: hypothetical protein GXP28_02875 [Planctomycetes bacterium]|nr:hypothetical protein [Planctomycetota bacterium]
MPPLIEKIEPAFDDPYLREKLNEGLPSIEAGEFSDWDGGVFKAQLRPWVALW